MNRLTLFALAAVALTACEDPYCPYETYSALTITPALPCLGIDLPPPHEPPVCTGDLPTVHNDCAEPFVVTGDGDPNYPYSDGGFVEVAAGATSTVEGPVPARLSSHVYSYSLVADVGAQTITITYQGTTKD